MCERFARLKKVELKLDTVSCPAVEGSRFHLLHLFFRAVDVAVKAATPGDTIRVVVRPGNAVRFEVTTGAGIECTEEVTTRAGRLSLLAPRLGVRIESVVISADPLRLCLHLPPVLAVG